MIQKGKIKHDGKSLLPTERTLWLTAEEKLNEARFGILQMKEAKDRVSYEQGWIRFIDSLEEFWTSLYHDGKIHFSGKFEPWMGKYKKLKTKDLLLSYLYQSRHKSQHAREYLQWETGKIQIAPNYYGHIKELKIFQDQTFEVDATSSGDTFNQVKLLHDFGKAILPTFDNGGETFKVPSKFNGVKIIDKTPLGIAELGLNHYEKLFSEAKKKFLNS